MSNEKMNQKNGRSIVSTILFGLALGAIFGYAIRPWITAEPETECHSLFQKITFSDAQKWMDDYGTFATNSYKLLGDGFEMPEGTNIEGCVIDAMKWTQDLATSEENSIYKDMGGIQMLYGQRDEQRMAILFPLKVDGSGYDEMHFSDSDGKETESIVAVPIQQMEYRDPCPPLCDYKY